MEFYLSFLFVENNRGTKEPTLALMTMSLMTMALMSIILN